MEAETNVARRRWKMAQKRVRMMSFVHAQLHPEVHKLHLDEILHGCEVHHVVNKKHNEEAEDETVLTKGLVNDGGPDLVVHRETVDLSTFDKKYEHYSAAIKANLGLKEKPPHWIVMYEYYSYEYVRPVTSSDEFFQFIMLVILIASVLVGAQTFELSPAAEATLGIVDAIILGIFTSEVVLKLIAEGCRPWRYFLDRWNEFDFVLVAACFLPGIQSHATMLRLLRLLRVLKVIKAFPELKVIVTSIVSSLPSLGYIALLTFMLFFLAGIVAVMMFGTNDPHHFGTLHIAILSLWRAATGEDWTELMYTAMYGCNDTRAQGGYYGEGIVHSKCEKVGTSPVGGVFFFVGFVFLGGMILMNLAVGVVIGSLFEAKAEENGDYILVYVDRAENLMIADYDVSGVSSSDPYCTATVGDISYSTKVVSNNINPEWAQELPKIPFNHQVTTKLRLEIFDWDLLGADDLLGSFDIDFSSLRWNKPVRFKLELNDSDKESFLYIKLRKVPGNNHILMEQEKDRWDRVQDKFLVAKGLIKDIEELLWKRHHEKRNEALKQAKASRRWKAIKVVRRTGTLRPQREARKTDSTKPT